MMMMMMIMIMMMMIIIIIMMMMILMMRMMMMIIIIMIIMIALKGTNRDFTISSLCLELSPARCYASVVSWVSHGSDYVFSHRPL